MIRIVIEQIVKPLKRAGYSKGKGELAGRAVNIDLERLRVTYDGQPLDLKKTPGTKGGYRYFFLCPYCGRRCGKLYKDYYYACGTCQKVHKATLNRSKTDCQYYWGLAIREARKIDPSYWPEKGYVDYDQFPSRPKRMKSNTYWRHYNRFCKYITKGIKLWLK